MNAPDIITTSDRTVIAGNTRQKIQRWYLTWIGFIILILVVAGALAIVAAAVLPRATITLVPSRSRIVSSVEVAARVGLDEAEYLNLTVPARNVQARVEGFDVVNSTGSEEAPVGNASGLATFINQTNREIPIPIGTIVRTTTGNNVRFRTVEEATVPAGVGQSLATPIEAIEPGRAGNIPAFTINEIEGPLNRSLRVSNERTTAGGTVETVAVVTASDKERVLGNLQESLQLQAYSRLADSLQQGEFIPNETVETFTLAETYDRFAGEQSEQLGLQLQLLARGLAVDMSGAEGLAERMLRDSVPPGNFLLEETLQVSSPTFVRFSDEEVALTLTASADTLVPIRASNVRNLLVGVPLDDAATLLEEELLLQEPPIVTLEPNWLNRLPLIPTRITVRVLQAGEQI